MKIIIEPMDRSLPTTVAYRSDRITSIRVEEEVNVAWAAGLIVQGIGLDEWLAKVRGAQLADLDAQEAVLRARYDMPTPDRPGDREARIAQARAAQGLPPTTGAPAIAALSNAVYPASRPQAAMQDVSGDTRHELRRVAMRAQELGIHVDVEPPATEAGAQAILTNLRGRIFDMETAAPKAAGLKGPSPAAVAQAQATSPTYGPAATVAPNARRCVDASHGREPQAITSAEWDFSVQRYGRPLCRTHQARGR